MKQQKNEEAELWKRLKRETIDWLKKEMCSKCGLIEVHGDYYHCEQCRGNKEVSR